MSQEDETPNPLAFLSPRAQKIAQQKVLTSLTDDQIMDRHGLTKRAYNKIIKDDHFQNYLKQCQLTLHNEEFFEQVKRQEMHLRQVMFDEVLSRFDRPDLDELGPDATVEQQAAYLERFAFYSQFKDIMRIWDQQDKRTRLNIGEATERVDKNEFVTEVQNRYTKVVSKRKRRQEMIHEAKTTQILEQDGEGNFRQIEAELTIDDPSDDFDEEVTMEEYLITKKQR